MMGYNDAATTTSVKMQHAIRNRPVNQPGRDAGCRQVTDMTREVNAVVFGKMSRSAEW
jgi:hypothetical protein